MDDEEYDSMDDFIEDDEVRHLPLPNIQLFKYSIYRYLDLLLPLVNQSSPLLTI